MSMTEWARREVELACKREAPDRKDGEWDYGCACYESALKAYESLMEDEHSGMSFGLTKQILIRLMNNLPLTPIEDTDDIWGMSHEDSESGVKSYQCKRRYSLFKDVYPDGTVKYHDNDYVLEIDMVDGWSHHMGFVKNVAAIYLPKITMPYFPLDKPYKVYDAMFLYDEKNGDFDTIYISHILKPDGEVIKLNQWWHSDGDNPWIRWKPSVVKEKLPEAYEEVYSV